MKLYLKENNWKKMGVLAWCHP